MTAPALDREWLKLAVSLARRAGGLSAELFYAGSGRTLKADGSEVTEADLAVEELLRKELQRLTPGDTILGEELGETAGSTGRRWIIDPISGTSYFTRRMPLFANLIAMEDEHGPALGIINMPIQGEMIFAGRGLGCWLLDSEGIGLSDATRTRVGDRARVDGALTLGANQHAWSEELLVALHRRVAMVGAIHHPVVHVVTGRADAAIITHQGYDDLAPLPIILAEAGGQVTDLAGDPVLSGDGTVLAANWALHKELLEIVSSAPQKTRGSKTLSGSQ